MLSRTLKDKLKLLKGELKIWNKEEYGNLYTIRDCILHEIESLDSQDLNGGPSERGRIERMELLNRLREVDRKIDSRICQKARVSWFKYGDSRTKFYHSSLRWGRRRNEVKGVVVGNQWCEEPCTVRAKQYRPISLVEAIYKVIAKLLTGRIKKVINSVVEESQSAFLKGRGILDSVLMANEA